MLPLWAWQLRVKNAGVADVGWTALVGGLAVGYALSGDGDVARRSAIGWMMGSWGARLAVYLLYDRVLGKPEEGRFAELGREWGDRATVRFFWLFQAHAAVNSTGDRFGSGFADARSAGSEN